MTPCELLKTWMGKNRPTADDLMKAPGFKIPMKWGRQDALLSFTKPITEVMIAAQVAFGEETMTIGFSKSAECQDFTTLVAAQKNAQEDLILAVFEAEFQHTLLSLATDPAVPPQVQKIIPPDHPLMEKAIPFHLVTADKGALIASGLINPTQAMRKAWDTLEFLDPQDDSLVTEKEVQGKVFLFQFDLQEEPEIGDYILLPELSEVKQGIPVKIILDNGLKLDALQQDDGSLKLLQLDQTENNDNAAIVSARVTLSYQQVLDVVLGQETKPITPQPIMKLWHHDRMAANGNMTTLVQTPAFAIETLTEN